MTTEVRIFPRASGVYVITWSSVDDVAPAGDVLLVDVEHAAARWCAIADILVHPEPAQDGQVSMWLDESTVETAWLRGRTWIVPGWDGQTITIDLPEHACPLACLAMVYRSILYDHHLFRDREMPIGVRLPDRGQGGAGHPGVPG